LTHRRRSQQHGHSEQSEESLFDVRRVAKRPVSAA
jgi:hypothetical protein